MLYKSLSKHLAVKFLENVFVFYVFEHNHLEIYTHMLTIKVVKVKNTKLENN